MTRDYGNAITVHVVLPQPSWAEPTTAGEGALREESSEQLVYHCYELQHGKIRVGLS